MCDNGENDVVLARMNLVVHIFSNKRDGIPGAKCIPFMNNVPFRLSLNYNTCLKKLYRRTSSERAFPDTEEQGKLGQMTVNTLICLHVHTIYFRL